MTIRTSVEARANTHTDPYVDWSFEVLPPHSHHKHPAPLTPARKPQLVLGQGEVEDQEAGAKFMMIEKACMDEGEGNKGNGDDKGDGRGEGEGEGQGESGVRLLLKVVRVRGW